MCCSKWTLGNIITGGIEFPDAFIKQQVVKCAPFSPLLTVFS